MILLSEDSRSVCISQTEYYHPYSFKIQTKSIDYINNFDEIRRKYPSHNQDPRLRKLLRQYLLSQIKICPELLREKQGVNYLYFPILSIAKLSLWIHAMKKKFKEEFKSNYDHIS